MIEMRWIVSDEGTDLGYTLQYREMKKVQRYFALGLDESNEWSEWKDVPIIHIDMDKKE